MMNRASVEIRVPKAVQLPLLVAVVAVLLFTAVAITTAPLAEWFQSTDRSVVGSAEQQKGAEEPAASAPGSDLRAKGRCNYCGIIESTRQVGALREVTVRLADRSTQVFSDPNPANWRPGERIILIGGGPSPRR